MAITQQITPLPPAPDFATDVPAVFSQKAAALVAAQVARDAEIAAWTEQANSTAAAVNQAVSGGAQFQFDTSTTAADPGAGKIRLNNTTQNAATAIYVDLVGYDTKTYTGWLDTFDDSTNPVKGQLILTSVTDPTKRLIFNVTAGTAPSGYRSFTVANVASSANSPFGLNELVTVSFSRAGDKGDKGDKGDAGTNGAGALILLASLAPTAGSVALDFLNVFSATYDNYLIIAEGLTTSNTSDASLRISFANGGVVDAGANFKMSGSAASAFIGPSIPNTFHKLEVFNTNQALPKGVFLVSASSAGGGASAGVYEGGAVSGFRIAPYAVGGGNTFNAAGRVRVYGIQNS